jgi:hypothetical protein
MHEYLACKSCCSLGCTPRTSLVCALLAMYRIDPALWLPAAGTCGTIFAVKQVVPRQPPWGRDGMLPFEANWPPFDGCPSCKATLPAALKLHNGLPALGPQRVARLCQRRRLMRTPEL